MKYRILITPLYGVGGKLHYYFNEKDDKASYCDALLSAEASCKFVLANHRIDEIITFGSKSTYDPGDDLKSCVLKEGSTFYATDINEMSTYSLFRYRMAEYLDEINVEEQDIRELLDEKQQKDVIEFVKGYFQKYNKAGQKHFNKFFDHLMQDSQMRTDFINSMDDAIPDFDNARQNYMTWTFQYLYNELKGSSKLELLEGNSDVKIRFTPVGSDGIGTFVENFTHIMAEYDDPESKNTVEIYMCVQSDDASDTFVMMNLMNLIKAMPETNLSIAKIITTTKNPDGIVSEVSDDTEKFAISDLLAGIRAFLRYGKTDLLLDYWNMTGIHNSDIERLLYAMRNIDIGISLCDISDIERGIDSLRELFHEKKSLGGSAFAEKFFGMIAESIRQDYGPLLKTENIEFFDLVKWAYRKGFWQQTLTIIESRAPSDFVNKGYYYYSNSPSCSDTVARQLAQIYYDLKPYEKWKLDDIEHYYIKNYSRGRATRKGDSKANQLEFAKLRLSELDEEDAGIIRAHTICPDREALKNLLFGYYYIGDVRNSTNHAIEEFDGFNSIMSDSDVGARMNMIIQSIEFFIHSYEVVEQLVKESNETADVDKVTHDQVVEYSKALKPKFPNNHGGYRGNRR
ncbi:MAG: hypothetical protein II493_06800 [Spirochaetales bacterium]|nr:hypothetical protein [Spirochaetales bacterium]